MRTSAFVLSLVFVFTIPWENALLAGEWGTLSRVIGIIMAGAWLASFLLKPQFRRPHMYHLLVVCFVLWNVTSLFWTAAMKETVQHIATYLQMAVLTWILWDLYRSEKALKAALQAYLLGAYVTVGATIYNFVSGIESRPYSDGRFTGAGLNANEVALILALGMPIAWHLASIGVPGKLGKCIWCTIYYAYMPAALFAVTLTATRAFLVAAIPVVAHMIVVSRRARLSSHIMGLAALGSAAILVLSFAPSTAIGRMGTIGQSFVSGDLGGRGQLWRRAFGIFSEHPIAGIGSGALHSSASLGSAAHNSILSVGAELGLVGLLIYGVIIGIVLHGAAAQPKRLFYLWMTVFSIWLIGSCCLTLEFAKSTWLFLNLIVISSNVCRRQPSESAITNPDYRVVLS